MEIYKTEYQEIHHFGGYCAVVWNIKQHKKNIIGEDKQVYTAMVPVREGKPYIDFVTVRYDDVRDEFYVSDDKPVVGGLSASECKKLLEELSLAIAYLESQS